MNLNRVFIGGNLTRDVELRTAGSTQVGGFGLAVNRRWKDKNGETQEEVTFIDCEAWGKTAETMAQYLTKGRPVFVEGRLKLDQWEQDGQKRSKLKVVVESFQFVGGKDDSAPGKASNSTTARSATRGYNTPAGTDDDPAVPW